MDYLKEMGEIHTGTLYCRWFRRTTQIVISPTSIHEPPFLLQILRYITCHIYIPRDISAPPNPSYNVSELRVLQEAISGGHLKKAYILITHCFIREIILIRVIEAFGDTSLVALLIVIFAKSSVGQNQD